MSHLKHEHKTPEENYQEALAEARQESAKQIRYLLSKYRLCWHAWAVKAYEQALREKGGK